MPNRIPRLILPFIVLIGFSGCALGPGAFAAKKPRFDVQSFYTGHTRSQGVIESRRGQPLKAVTTETWGRMRNGQLELTQDVSIGDGKPTRRVWQIRRLDEHRYEATTKAVAGIARGESQGNAFRFSYDLRLQPNNPLSGVHMEHWMYLQLDGRTMLNRVSVRKAGIVIAQISEVFQRVPAEGRRVH